MRLIAISALAAALTLSACSPAPQATDRCSNASNPTECRQWRDAGGDVDDYLTGAMIGYMLANRGGHTVIVQNPNYHGTPRTLRRKIESQDRQIARLQRQAAAQREELRRQKASASTPIRVNTNKPSTSSYRPSPTSYRPSTSSYRSSGSSFRRR